MKYRHINPKDKKNNTDEILCNQPYPFNLSLSSWVLGARLIVVTPRCVVLCSCCFCAAAAASGFGLARACAQAGWPAGRVNWTGF